MGTNLDVESVEMRAADVRCLSGQAGRHHLVVLEEVGGSRRLEIWVGPFEGEAIAVLLEQVAFPRPLTYQFMAQLLTTAGVAVREVRITRLTRDVFFAVTVVQPLGASRAAEVDARPSDAISLALTIGAPIRVAATVLEEVLAHRSGLAEEMPRAPARSRAGFLAAGSEGAAETAARLRPRGPGEGQPTP